MIELKVFGLFNLLVLNQMLIFRDALKNILITLKNFIVLKEHLTSHRCHVKSPIAKNPNVKKS